MNISDHKLDEILKDCAKLFYEKNIKKENVSSIHDKCVPYNLEVTNNETCLEYTVQKKYSKLFIFLLALILISIILFFLFFKNQQQRKSNISSKTLEKKSESNKKKFAKHIMQEMDINGDKKISNIEWKYKLNLFEKIDMNQDWFLTQKELEHHSQELEIVYQDKKKQILTPEQKLKVKVILSKYNALKLTKEDAMFIHNELRKAGLKGGPALRRAVEELGFKYDNIR